MSVTRPPSRSAGHERELNGLEQLEELGDDAIISQQTAAHAPQPRVHVSDESRSVVITDHPQRRDTEPPRSGPPRTSGEKTLVIRDRRALDELRANILRGTAKRPARRRNLYLWCALGLAAFVLGGVVAFWATDAGADAALSAEKSGRIEPQVVSTGAGKPTLSTPVSSPSAHAVHLDDLPLERPKAH